MTEDFSTYKDADLVSFLKGDKYKAEKAFAEIYSRYSQRIFAFCLRMIGCMEDAQDVFQEVFLKFYSSAKNMQYCDNLSALLITIARNLCINSKRSTKVTYTLDEYNVPTNDKGYEQKELLQLIAKALEVLDFEHREVFILRQYHGLSYSEISLITGESIASVKSRAWRAKEKVKDILNPYLVDISK